MSRRLSEKTNNTISATEPAETIATPKKGRKAVKVEAADAVVKSPAKSTKKVKIDIDYEGDNIEVPKGSPKIKINRVKAKAIFEEKKPKKASSKRKVKAEDDEDENEEGAGEKIVTKKRKTKEEKEAESIPLATRTSIELLKKGMYIGAHVSGAGGAFC